MKKVIILLKRPLLEVLIRGALFCSYGERTLNTEANDKITDVNFINRCRKSINLDSALVL